MSIQDSITKRKPGVGGVDAWTLSCSLSVRAACRRYRGDGHGGWRNETYERPMGLRAPKGPWAIYLADGADYWLACFDFDAHHGGDASAVRRDAGVCARLLADRGIRSVSCVSGPSGGMHVWAASLEGVPAALMRRIAMGMRRLLPTLDPTPLLNPVTGCARPPLSPHRDGGVSRPVRGDLDDLELPEARLPRWRALADALDEAAPCPKTAGSGRAPALPAASDGAGRPWIPGTRRPLPGRARRLLDTPVGGGDASAVQWSILLSAARCHWRFADVAALVDRPGMEHARTTRSGDGPRVPRPVTGAHGTLAVLVADWSRAVRAATAGASPSFGSDREWSARQARTLRVVRTLWGASLAAPARFSRPGGPADRRVLAALCRTALRAARPDVEANIRLLALECGLGRETARTALLRLAHDGWIRLARRAEGRVANRWTLESDRGSCDARSQVDTPPENAEDVRRESVRLCSLLDAWLETCSHDAFCGNESSRLEGNCLADSLTSTGDAEQSARLASTARPRLDALAAERGTSGTGERRRLMVERERIAWQWWLAELEWMRSPACRPARRSTTLLPDVLHGRFPKAPRHGFRVSWRRMRADVERMTCAEA